VRLRSSIYSNKPSIPYHPRRNKRPNNSATAPSRRHRSVGATVKRQAKHTPPIDQQTRRNTDSQPRNRPIAARSQSETNTQIVTDQATPSQKTLTTSRQATSRANRPNYKRSSTKRRFTNFAVGTTAARHSPHHRLLVESMYNCTVDCLVLL
jgi:hypothetical protein